MKKITITTLLLLLCAVWAVAQQSYPSSQSASPSSSDQTIKGCVSRADGEFTLTDKSGTTYKLTGDTAKLSDHVGHEVQIKGKTTDAGASAGASAAAGSTTSQPTLEVSSMKHIAETCSSKSKSDTKNQPMSEKPPTPQR